MVKYGQTHLCIHYIYIGIDVHYIVGVCIKHVYIYIYVCVCLCVFKNLYIYLYVPFVRRINIYIYMYIWIYVIFTTCTHNKYLDLLV